MLKPRFATFTWANRLVRPGFSARLESVFIRNASTSPSASTSPLTRYDKRRVSFFLGVGAVAVTGFLLYPDTVYADTKANPTLKSYSSLPLTQGLRGIDVAVTATSGEDRINGKHSRELGCYVVGIFDGHNGWQMAALLAIGFLTVVRNGVAAAYLAYKLETSSIDVTSQRTLNAPELVPTDIPPYLFINAALRLLFYLFDLEFVENAARVQLGLPRHPHSVSDLLAQTPIKPPHLYKDAKAALSFANSGSSALVGIFNGIDRSLLVALTGDSRAVLGRRVTGNKYEVHHLTADQNASNVEEVERLMKEHPDEPDLLKNHTALASGPLRSFGDGSMKWSREMQTRLHEKLLADPPSDECKTPPYLSAEPVVTKMDGIKPGDFAVFGSSGLWECLTSEEVVGLVGQWLEEKATMEEVTSEFGKVDLIRVPLRLNPTFKNRSRSPPELMVEDPLPPTQDRKMYSPSSLPVVYPPSYKDTTTMYKRWQSDKKFVCVDDSVAIHLMRNALGGANHELRVRLMNMKMPEAGKHRNDISVVVLFFD